MLPADTNAVLSVIHEQGFVALPSNVSDAARTTYYTVDGFGQPILEFSASVSTEWEGMPALTQGRIYGIFLARPAEFEKKFERITRYIRKHWRKNPVPILGGYVGPEAVAWFESGGLLLPMFTPPPSADWLRIMQQQHPQPAPRLEKTTATDPS